MKILKKIITALLLVNLVVSIAFFNYALFNEVKSPETKSNAISFFQGKESPVKTLTRFIFNEELLRNFKLPVY